MALLWIESCGGYTDKADVAAAYGGLSSITGYSTTAGRRGGPAFSLERNIFYLEKALGVNASTIIMGMAIQWQSWDESRDGYLLAAYDGGDPQCGIYTVSSTEIQIRRGASILATIPWVRGLDIWYFLEFKVTIDDSVGAYEVRVNGETIASATSVDTQNTANSYADTFHWGMADSGYGDGYICDIYGCDSSGTANNDFLGDVVIDYHVPTADSATHTGWTASAGDKYAAIDEAQSDDDTTYIYDDTADEKYAATLATVSMDNIKGVLLKTKARKDGAGAQSVTPFVRSGGTDYEQDTLVLGDSYLWTTDLIEDNPADSAAWESADINALEIGVKVG